MIRPSYLGDESINRFIDSALAEDIGEGDHSTLAAVPYGMRESARLLVKEAGVVAGLELAERIFRRFDPLLTIQFFKHDGETISTGDIAFVVSGPARSILSTERLVLNVLQRMSGIATLTRLLTDLLKGTPTKLLDTRKTTPNFRMMEKWAVAIGGGVNHRFGLYDMIMLKDNHVDLAGGVQPAIEKTQDYLRRTGKLLKIEIETRNLQEVKEVLRVGGVDIILLDNMSPEDMRTAVDLIAKRFKTEASGGISASSLEAIAASGVDYISMGALTHSAKSLDFSLKVISRSI